MPYNNLIDRTGATALIPEQTSNEVLGLVAGSNPILTLARRLRDMARGQERMPVVSALATAYFVDGDTGLKQTTEMAWENKYIHAAEIAAIVPIPQSVLDDAEYDIWGAIRPDLVTAFNVAIVQAALYGTNIPADWTTDMGAAGLVAGALAAGHNVSIAGFADLYEALLGESADGAADGLLALVEGDLEVADDLRVTAQGVITVTNGNPFTATGTYQPITAAGAVTPTVTGNRIEVTVT